MSEWNIIKDNKDIENLFMNFSFHDSCLKEMRYIGGGHVYENLSMDTNNNLNQVYLLFQTQWKDYSVIELCFERTIEMGFKPISDYYGCNIDNCYMCYEDENIVFFTSDDFLNDYKKLYEYSNVTWIKAEGCKWRVCEQYLGEGQVYVNSKG